MYACFTVFPARSFPSAQIALLSIRLVSGPRPPVIHVFPFLHLLLYLGETGYRHYRLEIAVGANGKRRRHAIGESLCRTRRYLGAYGVKIGGAGRVFAGPEFVIPVPDMTGEQFHVANPMRGRITEYAGNYLIPW